MRYAAFLRGMNVGGRRLTNVELCGHFEALGFSDVSAFLASGNVAFDAGRKTRVAERVEAGLRKALGYDVPTFLRCADDVVALARREVFSADLVTERGKEQVLLLTDEPTTAAAGSVLVLATEDDLLELRDLPARTVAYIRVLDPFRGRGVVEASRCLVAWAEERGAADGQWLGYMWEDPEIVALPDCRYDVALVVDDVEAHGEVGRFEFPAMRVAEVMVRGDIDLERRALDWVFRTWLPRSGHVPDEQPCFEAWCGRPFAHGMEHFEIAVQLPVVRG